MPSHESVQELLDRWEAWQAEGRQVSAEELCRDHPDLVEEVKQQIRALQAMGRLVRSEFSEPFALGQASASIPLRPIATIHDLVQVLRSLPLLEPSQMKELSEQLVPALPDLKALAQELLERGWLTAYQINQVVRGKGAELVLDDYLLLDLLGSGGMGQVFKAQQRRLKRFCALKLLLPGVLSSPGVRARFQREMEAAARLDHPNIVRVYDAGECRGVPYLAMEHLEGTDLSKHLKQTSVLAAPAACTAIRQACLGLQHAHEQGLVHRDLKPSNLMLTKQGIVKILDLGLAQLDRGTNGPGERRLTRTGTVMGTADYLAPEQTVDAANVDIRADLYSLGCSLYHLLTGQVPFPTTNVAEKLVSHQFHQPKPVEELRPGLPAGLACVVRQLMAKKPTDRFQTPALAAAALLPFTEAGALAGRPPSGQARNGDSPEQSSEQGDPAPPKTVLQPPPIGSRSLAPATLQPMVFETGRPSRRALGVVVGVMLLLAGAALVFLFPYRPRKDGPKSDRAKELHQSGLKHFQAGEYDKAIAEYTRAIQLDPAFVAAYLDRSDSCLHVGKYPQAIADCNEALRLLPKEESNQIGLAYARRGNVYRFQRDANRAIRDYTESLKYRPDSAKVYYFRGLAYAMKGDLRKAQQDKEKGLSLGYTPHKQ